MDIPAHVQASLAEAGRLAANGNFQAAHTVLRELLARGEARQSVLQAQLDLYGQCRRPIEAVNTLRALVEEVPHSLGYCQQLASLLVELGQYGSAISQYRTFIEKNPGNANALFNLALVYRQARQYPEAIAAYERALELDIRGPEEVFSNLGVLYCELRQPARAVQMYERSLAAVPDYLPALFNLAGLHEEAGQRSQAEALYRKILALEPRHYDSLSRLAYIHTLTPGDTALVEELELAAEEAGENSLEREGLLFALGKVLDDLQRYDEAAEVCRKANAIGRTRNPPYQPQAVEQTFTQLAETFSEALFAEHNAAVQARPVFICGMFRSGSTLLEQVLASHPAITAAGELDYIQWLVRQKLLPFPARVRDADEAGLAAIRDSYLAMLEKLLPGATLVTDKQPDNFLYLGLIRLLFPDAKIIYTRRHPLDNCLSIYFQQLGGNLNYATDMQAIAHYYRQHERLMAHWQKCFGDNIFTVDYDSFVEDPEAELHPLLDFLGLDWDENCLDFRNIPDLVKTASVWQVREGLHRRSSGRWKNYPSLVETIRSDFLAA